MADLTVQQIVDAVVDADHYNKFRQCLMHEMGETTKTDYAVHERNLRRAAYIRSGGPKYKHYKFNPIKHKASFIEDEFEEWR